MGLKLWTVEEVERAAILRAWQECDYEAVRTADVLGIGRTTLYRKLREYGVTRAMAMVARRNLLTPETSAQLDSLMASHPFFPE